MTQGLSRPKPFTDAIAPPAAPGLRVKAEASTGPASFTTSYVAVTFSAPQVDTLGMWASGQPTRFTVQREGWYWLAGRVTFPTGTSGHAVGGGWFKNGVLLEVASKSPVNASQQGWSSYALIDPVYLRPGDYLEWRIASSYAGPAHSGSRVYISFLPVLERPQ